MKLIGLIFLIVSLTSCLKTRYELGSNYQSQVFSKKQADNQNLQNTNGNQSGDAGRSVEPSAEISAIDPKDELIRSLNGRVEFLENQMTLMQKEKAENASADKMQLLQESLIKMEAQLLKLENELAMAKANPSASATSSPAASVANSKGTSAKASSPTAFDMAQDYFAKKDFKNAILEYQKFVDTNAKTKSKLLPEAKYKIGLSFESLGMKDEAQSFYEEVAAQHGSSEFGKKAKQKISKSKK